MEVTIPASWKRTFRAIVFRSPALTLATAVCWIVHAGRSYPAEYLFVPDREIWFVQAGTWLFLIGEGLLLGIVLSNVLPALAELPARMRNPPFASAGSRTLRFLSGRAAPIVAGVVSAVVIAVVWRSLAPVPVVHDEAAYLLQAKLLLAGKWKAAPAPIPEFFEQMYVFVWPFTAAKYPPGFPAALAPGVALGIPAIVPIALVGLSGGLLFSLARWAANPWIAAIAWVLWTTDPHDLTPPPAFMSQHLATLLWLASWWALKRWWEREKAADLLLVAFFIGWGAITRPLTMLAAAIPIGIAVLVRTYRRGLWAHLAKAAALGIAILLVIPLWSWKTTGSWRVTPLALHVRWYTPYDALGFGLQPPPPVRKLPPDLQEVTKLIVHFNAYHTVRNIPRLVVERAAHLAADVFPRWRMIFVSLLLFGALTVPWPASIATATLLADFVAYLFFPHSPISMYYEETYPILCFLAASGLGRAISGKTAEKKAGRFPDVTWFILLVAVSAAGVEGVYRYRLSSQLAGAIKTRFHEQVNALASPKAVVFLRYSAGHLSYRSLVENDADLSRQRIWLVYDRGSENARLRALAPDRTPYIYDEGRERLIRLDSPMSPEDRRWVGASATEPTGASPSTLPTEKTAPRAEGSS